MVLPDGRLGYVLYDPATTLPELFIPVSALLQFLTVFSFVDRTGNSLVECRLHPHLGGVVTGGTVAEAVKGATAGDIALTSFSIGCARLHHTVMDLLTCEIGAAFLFQYKACNGMGLVPSSVFLVNLFL